MPFEALGKWWRRVEDALKSTEPGLDKTARGLTKKYSDPRTPIDGD